jgi:ubiquitin C-terminal hydrolase
MSIEMQQKGLINIGNTCYLNSALQMLLQNEDFCSTILAYQNKSKRVNEISKFVYEYHSSERNNSFSEAYTSNKPGYKLVPNVIKDLVSSENKIFYGNRQNDAGEFLIWLLDLLITDVPEIKNIFNCKIQTRIKCKAKVCLTENFSSQSESFLILPINSNSSSMDDCYRDFKVHEKLEGDEQYFCEKCNAKRIASKTIKIEEWPKHLLIFLNRFQNINGRLRKNDQLIRVDKIWRHSYQLMGLVFHSGSLHGGHYIYIHKINNRWVMFNDSIVSNIAEEALVDYLNKGYIYYFKRINN